MDQGGAGLERLMGGFDLFAGLDRHGGRVLLARDGTGDGDGYDGRVTPWKFILPGKFLATRSIRIIVGAGRQRQ